METGEEEESTEMTKEKKPFRQKLKDVEYRRKFLHTLVLFASFLVLGLCDTIHFPAFLDLAHITNTNVEQASVFYTSMAVGGLVGTLGMGFLFDKLPTYRSLLLAGANLGSAVTITAIPWSSNYILTIFLFFICYVFNLAFDTGAHVDLFSMWGSDGKMFMQFLHFSYALGSIISPLMVEPFLAEETAYNRTSCKENIEGNSSVVKMDSSYKLNSVLMTTAHNVTKTNHSNMETSYKIADTFSTTESSHDNFKKSSSCVNFESRLHYAYLIAGILCFVTALVLIAEAFSKCIDTKRITKPEEERKHVVRSKKHNILVLVLVCVLYVFMTAPGDTIPRYLMPFGVDERGWTKETTAYLTSIYWAVFAAARLLAVFVIKLISAAKLLTICFLLLVISMGGLWISVVVESDVWVWVCIIASSGGFSVSFPTGFIYVERNIMKVSGMVASMIMLATNGAGIVNPLILGFLIGEVSMNWYIYLTLAQVVVAFVVFISLHVFVRNKLNPRKEEVVSLEIDASGTNLSNEDEDEDEDKSSDNDEEETLVNETRDRV